MTKISVAVERHTRYYLNMIRFYNRKKLSWRDSSDAGQIELALRRRKDSSKK